MKLEMEEFGTKRKIQSIFLKGRDDARTSTPERIKAELFELKKIKIKRNKRKENSMAQ